VNVPGPDSGAPRALPVDLDGEPDRRGSVDESADGGGVVDCVSPAGMRVVFPGLLPDLAGAEAVADGAVNGVRPAEALHGSGGSAFEVTRAEGAGAGFDNAVALCEVDPEGMPVEVRLPFGNANGQADGSRLVDGVEAGHRVGPFVVQDGADGAGSPPDRARPSFVDPDGGTARPSDDTVPRLTVDGAAADVTVFRSLGRCRPRTGWSMSCPPSARGAERA